MLQFMGLQRVVHDLVPKQQLWFCPKNSVLSEIVMEKRK